MTLHQAALRLLLLGSRLGLPPPPPKPRAPQRLQPLIDAVAPAHKAFDDRTVFAGHRYRSGFWAIYLLSAIALILEEHQDWQMLVRPHILPLG